MYSEIPQGKKIDIQGLYCNLPPEGYVWNNITKKVDYSGVYQRSEIKEEQYWERMPLPDWYKETMKRWDSYEKNKKDDAEEFYDEELEEYKKQEWDRRLNGFWFRSNGDAVYIVGSHYMYMQWWQIDIGYPKYRLPDLEYFYFLQYCIEDPNCMGMLEITKRRFGKTYRGGLFVTDYPTRTKMANGGIQSKTGGDAKKVFSKAVISPFKRLPRFFRPEYDMSGGLTPKTELRLQKTNVRGKKAEDSLDKDELGSLIDYQSADLVAYDGQKLHTYFSDEWAKIIECNIYDRHDVVRYCLLDDEGNIIGKALYSSTVEQLESEKDGVQEAAINLWNDSDHTAKGDNLRTASGLYRFFMTADRTRNFDLYGIPNVEKTVKAILADREAVKHNQRTLAARIRKEPRTIEEAFFLGNSNCEFNALNIQKQLQELEQNPVYLRKVRLIKNEVIIKSPIPKIKDKLIESISYMDAESGGWYILEEPKKPNNFKKIGEYYEPLSKLDYQIGVDTTKDDFAINGSKPTICVFKKSCIIDGEETGLYPVALYLDRARLDIHFDEEVLKACMWYGCTANYEVDAGTQFYRYFAKLNANYFLEWTPKFAQDPVKMKPLKPGSQSSDPFQLAAQLQVTKMYIDGTSNEGYNGHVHRVKFPTLLQQLLKYDHSKRTPYDQVISLMMCLLCVIGDSQLLSKTTIKKPTNLFPKYDIKLVS